MYFKTNGVIRYDDTTPTGLVSSTMYANSLHDPFGELGSQQPCSYDQMGALYKKYKVTEGQYKVTINNPGTHSIKAALGPTTAAAPSTYSDFICLAGVSYCDVPAGQSRTLFTKFNVSNMIGKDISEDTQYAGVMVTGSSQSPGGLVYVTLNLYSVQPDDSAGDASYTAIVEAVQLAKIYDYVDNVDA